jgi:predicted alpha-1,2-mannosidase
MIFLSRIPSMFFLWAILSSLGWLACEAPSDSDPSFDSSVVQEVDPFIGTGGHGHTYPGATAPFGLVQLSPDTRLTGWDGCSGYHFTDTVVYGFSHTHLSGTGVSDYGDVLLMPFVGTPVFDNAKYAARFDKSSEKASPGYYQMQLVESGIGVELTAGARTGVHRYSFPGEEGSVLLDLIHRDVVLESGLRWVNATTLEGYRISSAWATEQHVYFAIEFSAPIQGVTTNGNGELEAGGEMWVGKEIQAAFEFASGELEVKMGLSAVDLSGAWKNLQEETEGRSFDAIRMDTERAWAEQLGRIQAEASQEVLTNFYTALYHLSIVPNVFSDVDGRFRGLDQEIHQATGHTQYTVFSLWDTYRAAHPLYTILEPERTTDFINSFLYHYQQGGELPVWELAGNETYCMIGYHSIPVIADAYSKGIRGFNEELALEAMVAAARQDKYGKVPYRDQGYIASNQEAESVSKTLEYAFDDWCIAQMAKSLGEETIYQEFLESSQAYKNLFDPETGFFRARNRGAWVTPFDPFEVNFHFTEANAWQYSNYVPHDIQGWIDLHGGEAEAEAFLDRLFNAESATTGRDQADITGLIGQYAHGNEPSHHMAYLYMYLGAPEKTQALLERIMDELYRPQPDGLSGNEDCGQMSAWYVFSALGMYPVNPADGVYVFGKPFVDQARIQLTDGKIFEVVCEGEGQIQRVTWRGEEYPYTWLRHEELMEGGELVFYLDEKASDWGKAPEARPQSAITEHLITPVPAREGGFRAFRERDTVRLNCADADAKIFYTLDGSKPEPGRATLYQGAFEVTEPGEIRMVAQNDKTGLSKEVRVPLFRMPTGWNIELATAYAPQYAASGDRALIDGLRGGTDFRTGEWQGYQEVDLEAVVDLGESQLADSVAIRFLQDENAWIFMPEEVTFYGSQNGKDFILLGKERSPVGPKEKGAIIHQFRASIEQPIRYIKIVGKNRGECPPFHKGAGGKAWIFADEILLQ